MSATHQVRPEKKRSGIDAWIDERIHTGKAIDFVLNHPVPLHVHPLDYLGEVTLFIFISQAVTGMLLAMAYHPVAQTPYYFCATAAQVVQHGQHICPKVGTVSPSEAWQSIQAIMGSTFGSLIRSMHFWGNYFMVVLVIMHMLRGFFVGAYKYPREMTWLSGVLLLAMTLGFAFTGYLLPWDQKAYWATQVGINIADTIPIIGPPLADFVRGGPLLTGVTLGRFFAIHMLLLPALTGGLIGLHLLLVNIQGVSAADGLVVLDDEGTVLQQIPDAPEAALSEGDYYGGRTAGDPRTITATTLRPSGSAPGTDTLGGGR
jgi:quinol-cytochrome oxidoreductase complex cytochrome b subunit